ncbi:MAG: UDP-glucose/GDP-mannose dehydrogenase family protein [Actinomycetota bacterium]
MSLTLSVIGTGYLGTTHAACMASLGFDVIGIDTDSEKIASLNRGELHVYEPGLEELLKEQLASGRLTFTTDISKIAQAEVHFICVGTPQVENSLAADLTFVQTAFQSLLPHLKTGSLIVGKSTVPVGTAQSLATQLSTQAPHAELAWNPEFLREGFAVEDTLRPNRVVVGVQSERAENVLKEVFASLIEANIPWITADLPTSELVKVAANAFLATKISFINAMAEICEVSGADVTVLAKSIGYDPRIGHRFLQAGIGFGGGCLPKDLRAFMARADELGTKESLAFLAEIDAINLRARQRVIPLVTSLLNGVVADKKIAILGAAFKPNSDDVRDSPALDIASILFSQGAQVSIHDPKAISNARSRFPNFDYSETVEACVDQADIVLHLTEWAQYREIDPLELKTLVRGSIIVDGRNALDRDLWRSAGWKFHSVGRKTDG